MKSLITAPQSGVELAGDGATFVVRGHAWAGDNKVTAVDVSVDFGATWVKADLKEPHNPYA